MLRAVSFGSLTSGFMTPLSTRWRPDSRAVKKLKRRFDLWKFGIWKWAKPQISAEEGDRVTVISLGSWRRAHRTQRRAPGTLQSFQIGGRLLRRLSVVILQHTA